jgi:NDP-sugar pyrophosphorylase family protein/aminoglycoside/choline kinase family phosphotransferase
MKGMVLAAGFGTRMLPVTRFVPKALLPVAGRPLLDWNLRYLASQGVDDVVVNAHHLPDEMRRWETELREQAEPGFPVIRLVVEPEILGTGGGIANAAEWLDSEPVVVVNADQVFQPDLAPARQTHGDGRYLATLLCVRDPRHAQVRVQGTRVTAIDSRAIFDDPSAWTFTGVYLLAREAIDRIAAAARAAGPRGYLEIVPLFRAWLAEGLLGAHLVEDRLFLEAGSPEAYLELLREAPAILDEADDEEDARARAGYIGPGARIGHGASIEESAVLDGAAVASHTRVSRCILGPGAEANEDLDRRIMAGGESRAIHLLPPADEHALRNLIARTWPAPPDVHGPSFPRRSRPLSLRLLKGDGSARRIVRAVRGAESRILVLPATEEQGAAAIYPRRDGSAVPDEAASFAYLAPYLENLDVPVPRVYLLDPETRVLLLEDLGDIDLFGQVAAWRREPEAGDRLWNAYREAIEILLRMQASPREPLDPSRTHNPPYDEAFIRRFEAGYFLREMVHGQCHVEQGDADALEAELGRIAREALSAAPRVFMHRDFQSRNLMRPTRGLVVIDFQGARPGPPEYDLAALLLDPYVDLPAELRDRLVELYLAGATRAGSERHAARRRYRASGINRMLQVLGAFAYLGGRLGKPGFLEHAPVALARVRELAGTDFPHLTEVIGRVQEALAPPR